MSARAMLQRACGLNLAQADVDRALRERMAKCGIADPDQYLLQISPDELAALIELVVVPESWMFRDPDAFAAATALVQRRLAADPGRVLRILSIPCAGGEEPYSMAMALQDAGIKPEACPIEAFDLSAAALERARHGRYTRNAFRGAQLEFRDRYFTGHGAEYQIADAIRERVAFGQANLLSFDSAANAGRYDLVFCRNLLIYFDEPTAAAAIARLHTLLADDGVLFAGYAEVPLFCRNRFAALRLAGAFALRKECAVQPARTAPRQPAPARLFESPLAAVEPPAAPETFADLLVQARKLADQGDYQRAGAACQAALAAAPDSAEAYFILGMLCECEKKPALAEYHWRRCVYLQPGHYQALCHLALLAEQAGNAPQASAFRQRAARIFGRSAGL
jgi:chemotaxis protein methyltransferase WspC